MLKDSNIISFGGFRNTGKDTSASMLQFMLNTPSIFHYYWIFKHFNFLGKFGKWKVTSFAKPLKEVLSIILGVPIEKFEDRDFKENYCVDLNNITLHHKEQVQNKLLSECRFAKQAENLTVDIKKNVISIRQLMQYWATDIMRRFFGENIWINTTLNKSQHANLIISDLRFKAEACAVKERNGVIIYIERPGCFIGHHKSEREVFELYSKGNVDFVINNNGTLKDLFNKLKIISSKLL